MSFNPNLQATDISTLVEDLSANGREAAIIREYGPLKPQTEDFLDEPLDYLLDGVAMSDKGMLSKTVKALNSWGEHEPTPVTARTALALSAQGLVRVHNIGYGAVQALETQIKNQSGISIPKLPEPEFAAYFCRTLKDVPAHTVTADYTDASVRLYPSLTMADAVPPPHKGISFESDADVANKSYVRGYRRRFMLSQLVYRHLLY